MKAILSLAAGIFVLPASGAVFTSELVANLPPTGGVSFSSDPSSGVQMGGFFYFAASEGPNGSTGRELWRTDGTPAGTTLVRDIRPGAADSSPRLFTVAGNTLYFVADDGAHGEELWKSDGTPGGTLLVKDIRPGTGDSSTALRAVMGNTVLFTADDGSNGRELWKSDGTAAGTAMVTNMSPGAGSSTLFAVTAVGGFAYFGARTNSTGSYTFFKTDGTPGGTVRLAGTGGIVTASGISGFETFGNEALFVSVGSGNESFWRTDGTPAGSAHLETVTNGVWEFRILESFCYYTKQRTLLTTNPITGDPVSYTYGLLARRSLSPGGTSETLESRPASEETTYEILTVTGGRLYYLAKRRGFSSLTATLRSVANGASPVLIDSTTDNSSPLDSTFEVLGPVGGWITYVDENNGQSIFRTDGASAGTVALNFTSLGLSRSQLLVSGARIFFTGGTTNTGTEIGVTDLTPAGTQILADVRPGTFSSDPAFLGFRGSSLIFSADNGLIGEELWRSDGTTNGTILLKDIAPGADSPPPAEAITVGSTLFLSVETPGMGRELWKSDGTEAGTRLVKDIRAGINDSAPANLTAWNGMLYFTANDGTNGVELWQSDGTEAGTFMLKNVRVGAAGSNPAQLTAATGLLFFVADDGAHGAELWRSDGTANGTYMTHDIVPGLDSGQIDYLSAAGNLVYFIADAGSLGRELWFSDGQPGGTQFLKDLTLGPASSDAEHFTGFNGMAYFVVNSTFPSRLWRTDGTPAGTELVKTNISGELRVAGNVLFASSGSQLWTSDGTTTGTVLLKNVGQPIRNLTAVAPNLYFTAREDLWTSDGTSNGTVLVADFPDMGNFVFPERLTHFQGTLLFTAQTPTYGREIWSLASDQTATLVEDLEPGSADAAIQFLEPTANKVFYVARPSGQPAWQVRALRLESVTTPQTGWTGAPTPVPGRIEAEHFDRGGEGQAYHDTTLVNEGGQFRVNEAVDLEACNDTGGGFCVAQTQAGEWLEYTFDARVPGYYRIDTRAFSASFNARFHLSIDDAPAGGLNAIPPDWATISVPDVPLTTGVHVLRLTFDNTNTIGDAGRINWIEFTATPNQPPIVTIQSPPAGAIYAPGEVVLLAAAITDSTTTTSPQVEFFMDEQSLGFGPASRSWIATPGAHVLRVHATDSFGASTTSSGRLFFVTEPTLPYGSVWRYDDSGRDRGTTWRLPGFNDSAWPSGAAELGFGDGDESTVVDGGTQSAPHTTVYFRRSVTLTNIAAINYASVSLRRDDGAVLYINGHHTARPNLPKLPANILYSTLAVTNIGSGFRPLLDYALDTIPVPLTVLSNGANIFAVELHQAAGGSPSEFDLSFDLSFAVFSYRPEAVLQILAKNGRASVRWPDHLQNWQLEQSADLASWTPVDEPAELSQGFYVVVLPMQSRAFFRLRSP